MNTRDFTTVLPTILSELVNGSPDPNVATYTLNRGDEGLLKSLDKLSAAAASKTSNGGSSIAAHADHIRYGLSLLNRWAAGEVAPWKNADWTASWRKPVVSDAEWRTLRDELRRETQAWIEALRTPREVNDSQLGWITGSVSHLAYHLGSIRQIDRATRGPSAEDERRAEQRSSASS
jgi:hypothetical protein